MPRAKTPKAPAAAAKGAPPPSPIPPSPSGPLPGGPQGFAPQPGYMPPAQQGYALPPGGSGFGIPGQQPGGIPAQFIPQQQVDANALMQQALGQTQPTQAPQSAIPTQAPPIPQTLPPVQDNSATSTVLPQLLDRLNQLTQQGVNQHGDVMGATGSYNQARAAEFAEIKQGHARILDALGGVSELLVKIAQTLQIVPQQQAGAPVQQAQLQQPQQAAPQGGYVAPPQFSPGQPQQQFQQAAAPQQVQVPPPNAAPAGPQLSNPAWAVQGILGFATTIVKQLNGQHASLFIQQMQNNPTVAAALTQDDMVQFLRAYNYMDGTTGNLQI